MKALKITSEFNITITKTKKNKQPITFAACHKNYPYFMQNLPFAVCPVNYKWKMEADLLADMEVYVWKGGEDSSHRDNDDEMTNKISTYQTELKTKQKKTWNK